MPSPKKLEPATVAPKPAPAVQEAAPAPQSLEDMLKEPTLDSLMAIGERLSELTRAASIALSQFNFKQSRVDHGDYKQGPAQGRIPGFLAAAPFDEVARARVHAMASACHEFSLAMRNAANIGVHQ
jgi:hypothetical protein